MPLDVIVPQTSEPGEKVMDADCLVIWGVERKLGWVAFTCSSPRAFGALSPRSAGHQDAGSARGRWLVTHVAVLYRHALLSRRKLYDATWSSDNRIVDQTHKTHRPLRKGFLDKQRHPSPRCHNYCPKRETMYTPFIETAEVVLPVDKHILRRRYRWSKCLNWVHNAGNLRHSSHFWPTIVPALFNDVYLVIFIRSNITYICLSCYRVIRRRIVVLENGSVLPWRARGLAGQQTTTL